MSDTSGDLVVGDSFTGALTRTAGETVAGSPYAINQGTLALNTSNYDLTYVSAGLYNSSVEAAHGPTRATNQLDPSTADPRTPVHPQRLAQMPERATGIDQPVPIDLRAGHPRRPELLVRDRHDGQLQLNPAPIDVDANPASKTYGDADPGSPAG